MSVKIGHARIDERGLASGGAAGDQSGGEVCTRSWYAPSGGWGVLLRPVDSAVAERMAAACEAACANPKIGYDQYQRNTLRTQARKVDFNLAAVDTACECDCSSLMAVCAECAGVPMDSTYSSGNAPTTSTMRTKFVGTGAFTALTDGKYLTQDSYLRRGDILVLPGKHTVMVLSNGDKADSTTSTTTDTKTITSEVCKVELKVLKKSAKCDAVKALQILLIGYGYSCGASGVDGSFGAATDAAVRAFQRDHGLTVDGSVGPKTWGSLLGVA